MMTKELSKQLCELCGVEPFITYECSRSYTNPYFTCVPPHCGKCDDAIILEKKYPDFGQPENFVTLLEINFKTSKKYTDEDLIVPLSLLENDFKNSYLQGLHHQLKTYGEKFEQEFKQSIREAEWMHE